MDLRATVTDARGHFLTGLDKDAFAVFEDGVRQHSTFFGAEDVPIDLTFISYRRAEGAPLRFAATVRRV